MMFARAHSLPPAFRGALHARSHHVPSVSVSSVMRATRTPLFKSPALSLVRPLSFFSHPTSEPEKPSILSPKNLFRPLSKSPVREMRDRAALINKYGVCPVCEKDADATAGAKKQQHDHKHMPPTYECPDCGYPTHCSEEHYLKGKADHDKYCAALREANEDEHDLRSGRKLGEFEFPGAQGFDETINMANWDTFFYTRGFPSMDTDRSMRHVSKLLTYPITIASAFHRSSPLKVDKELTPEGLRSIAALRTTLYPRQEFAKDGVTLLPTDTLRIYLIGARAEASLPPHIWLQLAYLFPQTPFHLYFIGPEAIPAREVPTGEPGEPFSTSLDTHLTFTYDPSFYHDYYDRLGGANSFDPYRDVFFLFSPGFAQPPAREVWQPSVARLLETKCAVFVTGFDEEDVNEDIKAFEQYHKEYDWILKPGENTFRSLKRDVNLEDVRQQIFSNWGIWGFRGKRYEITQEEAEK